MVHKPDGTVRITVDYKPLNKIIKGDVYPLPNIVELYKRLTDSDVFSKIDLRLHIIRYQWRRNLLSTPRSPANSGYSRTFQCTSLVSAFHGGDVPKFYLSKSIGYLFGWHHCTHKWTTGIQKNFKCVFFEFQIWDSI